MREVSDEKLDKYFSLTKEALEVVKISVEEKDPRHKIALDFLQMAKDYFEDAQHFRKEGNYPTALAAASYAHAWLDAGARMGVFDTQGNSKLFASD